MKTLVIALLLLVVGTGTAFAECAWVLWRARPEMVWQRWDRGGQEAIIALFLPLSLRAPIVTRTPKQRERNPHGRQDRANDNLTGRRSPQSITLAGHAGAQDGLVCRR